MGEEERLDDEEDTLIGLTHLVGTGLRRGVRLPLLMLVHGGEADASMERPTDVMGEETGTMG